MATLPKTNLRQVYHVACTLGEVVNGHLETRLSKLCTSSKINKWAKYKPVHNTFTTDRPSDWWKGTMRNCGIEFLRHNTVSSLISSIDSGEEQLPYTTPRGGEASPYRLGDFCGYNPDATPPIYGANHEGTYYKNNDNLQFMAVLGNSGEDYLQVSDVFGNALENMYYAAALKTGTRSPIWLTAEDVITENNNYIDFPTSSLNAGTTYYLYQFLCSYSKPTLTSEEKVGYYVAIPGTQKQEIKIQESDLFVDIRNVDYGLANITGDIYVDNTNGQTQTLTNVRVYFVYADFSPNDAIEIGEKIVSLDDIHITSGQKLTVHFESGAGAIPEYQQRGGKILLYFNNQLQAQVMI